MTIPSAPLQNLPMASSLTNTSSLPISGERHNHQPTNKRPKIAPTPGQLTPPGALSAHTPTFPYDHDSSYRLSYPVPQNNLHSHSAGFSNPGIFPGTPPPNSNLFDFPRPQRNPSYPDAYGGQQRLSHGHDASLGFLGPGPGGHRNSTSQGQNFGGFDWPVHQQQHQQPQPPQSAHHSPTQPNHNPHDTSWLEMFASASSQAPPQAPHPEPTPLHLPSAYPASSASSSDSRRPSLSWERQQHDPPSSTTANTNQAGTASAPNSAVVSPALSHKRARVDSTASDVRPGSVGSVGVKDGEGDVDRASVNGAAEGIVKKEGEGAEGQSIPAD